ncbi:MAG TPA: TRAP transporter TatT component family protein [Pyrinomonadaceae bacterium]|jgi:tetratricopeptide (TPR) repeat protein
MKISVVEMIERADALYATREDAQGVSLSVELLEAALEREFDYELAWRLGRALFFLGQEAQDKAVARAFHLRAVRICEMATRREQSRVEGHFWLGVNRALLAALEKPLTALGQALRARRSLRRAINLDAAYHAAGPLRVLARLEAKLPVWLGGGRARAQAHFEQALALAPANTVTRLYFAELLIEAGDEARAHSELQALLGAPFDPTWAFEIKRDRRLAQAMLRNSLESGV